MARNNFAVAEGLNSKIQSLKAAARGFRNFEHYRIRILFFCGKLDLSSATPVKSHGICRRATVSMNMVMVGMFPAMVILKHLLHGGEDPLEPLFWFITSMAVLVSGGTAYPINSWLVARGIKHGMMSAPEPGAPAMGMGRTGRSE